MVAEDLQAPEVPATAVVGQVLIGNRDVFAGGGRAAGQGEHMDLVVAQESPQVALADSGDVGLVVFVAGDGQASAKVGDGADLVEMVIAREGGVGVTGEDAAQ